MPLVAGMILVDMIGSQAIPFEVRDHAGQQSVAVIGDIVDRQPTLAFGCTAATDRDQS